MGFHIWTTPIFGHAVCDHASALHGAPIDSIGRFEVPGRQSGIYAINGCRSIVFRV
jgi:hypothetical protein